MKVLVTGATGLIGTALCDALLRRGDDVAGLTRDPAKARLARPGIEWHPWEPTLERPPAAAFEGVDGVVNLVGEKINQRWTAEAKQRIMESRRTATHNLVGAIASLERKPKVLVSQSAVGYYGDRGDAVLDESEGPGSSFDAEVVQAWEEAAREVETSGVRLVVVRTGQVLDAKGGLLGELLTPFKLGLGGPIAGGGQYLSWIHRDDELGILLWALDNEAVSGVVNASAPEPARNRDFTKALGKALGRPAVLPLPGFALDLKFGREFGQVLRGGQRVIPKKTLELGYEFRFPRLDGA
ncbi:MAG TPA: TIGR01777 family oxidoreductase, partial [Solirubrobacterales bacterium]|nr:TIGR01777 family oxidoreductase [Solirubrobacterales bacterium]